MSNDMKTKRIAFIPIIFLLMIVSAFSVSADWSYRKSITINHVKVVENLNNFPVVIELSDSDLATHAKPDGSDIYFTLSDGITKIDHEIEKYQSGELVAWVEVPQLSSSVDTVLYMYYGNPDASDQQNVAGTWDASHISVYHMNEISGTVFDSSHDNDGTPVGGVSQNVFGNNAGADQFDGGNDRINLPQIYDAENQFTMSAWIQSGNKQGYIVSQRDGSQNGAFLQFLPASVQLYVGSTHVARSTTANQWHYVTGTYDGATARLYVDGNPAVSAPASILWPDIQTIIGDRSTGDRQYLGKIDEVRLSNVARSAGYVRTSYNNQQLPALFYSVGPAQPVLSSAGVSISETSPTSGITTTHNPMLKARVTVTPNVPVNVAFETNASGTWTEIGSQTGQSGIFQQPTSGLDTENKRYHWRVKVTSGSNVTYSSVHSFVAQAFVLKWRYTTNASAHLSPLAVDINNDGNYEVFATGAGKITALNGKTGAPIWVFSESRIYDHSPIDIGDLDNDGTYEIVVASGYRTYALNAESGSVQWMAQQESQNKFLMIIDADYNNMPYVYTASGNFSAGENGDGRLRKLRGSNGQLVAERFLWYPCYGGITAADVNNDGKIEIYTTDRKADYETQIDPTTGQVIYKGLGKGVQAYDADTLDLLWFEGAITTSSHLAALIDVNNDGILDAIGLPQAVQNGGIFVMDGVTGQRLPGKTSFDLGLGTHSPFSVYDVDEDGRLELVTARANVTKVWDLGTWTLDATLDSFAEPPMMANVMGDESLEIVGAEGVVRVYNGQNYSLMKNIWDASMIAGTIVQDIDGDGQNELIGISHFSGTVSVYDTGAYAPTPRVRTNNHYYSERRLGAGVYIPPVGEYWLADNGFTSTASSEALRDNAAGQDWYESRSDVATILSLDTTDVGGNSGNKAKFSSNTAGNAYLSQELDRPALGGLAAAWDVYVDDIADISGAPDRTAFMMVGDDSVPGVGPNSNNNERFVMLAFAKNGGGSNGNMDLVALDRDDSFAGAHTVLKSNLNLEQWHRIRVYMNFNTDTYTVFVNGENVGTVTSRMPKSQVTHISFAQFNDGAGTFYIDNVQAPAKN